MQKRQDIELLRIISAFGIVWFHAGIIWQSYAYSGLIVFLVMSVFLAGKSRSGGVRVITKRAQRLLTPWAIWFAIYAALNIAVGKPLLNTENGIIAGILEGPSVHLWYMPFIFLSLILFDGIKAWIPEQYISWFAATLATGLFVLVPVWRPASIELGYPYAQYAHSAAAVFTGICLAYLNQVSNRVRMLLLAVLFIAMASTYGFDPGFAVPYLIGSVACMLLTFEAPGKWIKADLTLISGATLGIYFMHVIFIAALVRTPLDGSVMLPVTAFLLSLACTLILKKISPSAARYFL